MKELNYKKELLELCTLLSNETSLEDEEKISEIVERVTSEAYKEKLYSLFALELHYFNCSNNYGNEDFVKAIKNNNKVDFICSLRFNYEGKIFVDKNFDSITKIMSTLKEMIEEDEKVRVLASTNN